MNQKMIYLNHRRRALIVKSKGCGFQELRLAELRKLPTSSRNLKIKKGVDKWSTPWYNKYRKYEREDNKMDIIRSKKDMIKVIDLEEGDTFLFDDDVFITTDDFNPGEETCTVVCLRNGSLVHLNYNDEVTIVKCTLNVEG